MKPIYEEVLKAVKEAGYNATLKETVKNGVKLCGLNIMDPESNMAPVIYLDYLNGNAEEMAQKALEIYEDNRHIAIDVDEFMNREFFEEHITIALQRKSDEDLVKKTFLEDMEQYLVVMWNENRIKLRKQTLDYVGLEEDEAWKNAQKNLNEGTKIISVCQALNEMNDFDLPEEIFEDVVPMYVIQANGGIHGASGILNTRAVAEFAKEHDTNRIIFIPSSVHEGIIIPVDDDSEDIDTITRFVKETNQEEVDPIEQLADRAYMIEV